MTMKYFLYGNSGCSAKHLTGLPISAISFDYSIRGYNHNHNLCDSKFLWRHFRNDYVNIIAVHGNNIEIDII